MKKTKLNVYSLVALLSICLSFFFLYSCVPAKKAQGPKKVVKQCFDCHQEFKTKFSSGIIHAPVKEESCYSCHRPHGLYGKIVFRVQQPDLCYACHNDIKPGDSAKSVHEPINSDKCTVCHDSHNSDFSGLLKAEGDASCFTCHGQEAFKRKRIHQPLEKGCNTCHAPHHTANVTLLKQDPDATCRSCHNVKEALFSKAHFTYPVTTGCIKCHTPHSSAKKGLLKKNVHEPVRTGKCDSCHVVSANKEIKTKDKADTLCLECHKIHTGAKSVHQPYTQGQCTSCHDVHASDYRTLFVAAPEKVCLNCHAEEMGLKHGAAGEEEKAEDVKAGERKMPVVKSKSMHKPVTDGKCLECHKGHVSEHNAMLSEDIGTLCYKCHEQNGYAGTSGSHSPDKNKNCETCHVPHSSPAKSLLKGEDQRNLCYGCHKKTSSERGKFSLHKPFARGECGKCHQLHRPEVSGYLVKPYETGELCLTCHEDSAQKGSENYSSHDPVSKRQCNKCHSPHAADNDHVMSLVKGEQCYVCHPGVKNALTSKKVKHQPVKDGMCTTCHSAHGSAQKYILKKNQPALCITCHVDVAKDWLKGYPHKPAVTSCLKCHGSHGTDQKSLLVKPSGSLCIECHDVKTGAFLEAHGQINPRPASCVSCHNPHGSKVKSMLFPVVHSPFEEGTCTPCHAGGKK